MIVHVIDIPQIIYVLSVYDKLFVVECLDILVLEFLFVLIGFLEELDLLRFKDLVELVSVNGEDECEAFREDVEHSAVVVEGLLLSEIFSFPDGDKLPADDLFFVLFVVVA